MPISFSGIGVALFSLATMVALSFGARMRRGLQSATVLANGGELECNMSSPMAPNSSKSEQYRVEIWPCFAGPYFSRRLTYENGFEKKSKIESILNIF